MNETEEVIRRYQTFNDQFKKKKTLMFVYL